MVILRNREFIVSRSIREEQRRLRMGTMKRSINHLEVTSEHICSLELFLLVW